jgi:hypothetical protein
MNRWFILSSLHDMWANWFAYKQINMCEVLLTIREHERLLESRWHLLPIGFSPRQVVGMVVIRAYIAKESETMQLGYLLLQPCEKLSNETFMKKHPFLGFVFFQLCDIKNLELFSKNLAQLAKNYTKKQKFQFF